MTGIAKKISPLLNASGDAARASAKSYISDPALARYLRDLDSSSWTTTDSSTRTRADAGVTTRA
jgi:hypothetical protein